MDEIKSIGAGFLYYETALLESPDDPEETLNVALTHREVTQISFAMAILALFYGEDFTQELRDKFSELMDAQEFCKCPRCSAEREEKDDEARPTD